MKIKTILPLFAIVFTNVACNQSSEPKQHEPKAPKVTLDADTISQAQFDMWTAAWEAMGANYSDTALVKYYTMPVVDLAAVLGERATGVRFYQGLEELAPGQLKAHLIAVGLDEKKAIIPKYYDYTNPCPPICQ